MQHIHEGAITSGESGIKKGFLMSFIFVIGIGAINFGYSIGVFNSMNKDFSIIFQMDKDQKDLWVPLIQTLCSLGAAIGSLTAGPFTRFGKKLCIHVANVLLIIGCSLTLIKNLPVIAVGRFLFGLSAGTFSVFVPSYINEVTPTELKGQFGSAT